MVRPEREAIYATKGCE
jgi:hypothetical protein